MQLVQSSGHVGGTQYPWTQESPESQSDCDSHAKSSERRPMKQAPRRSTAASRSFLGSPTIAADDTAWNSPAARNRGRHRRAARRVARRRQQSVQPLGADEQPRPTSQASSGHFARVWQESSPAHVTSHAHELSHRTPLRHESSPLHVTAHRPLPQKTRSRQLRSPVHNTWHGVVGGQ